MRRRRARVLALGLAWFAVCLLPGTADAGPRRFAARVHATAGHGPAAAAARPLPPGPAVPHTVVRAATKSAHVAPSDDVRDAADDADGVETPEHDGLQDDHDERVAVRATPAMAEEELDARRARPPSGCAPPLSAGYWRTEEPFA